MGGHGARAESCFVTLQRDSNSLPGLVPTHSGVMKASSSVSVRLVVVLLYVSHQATGGRVSDQTSDTSDGHSKKAIRATSKAIIPVDSTLGVQTKYKISKA